MLHFLRPSLLIVRTGHIVTLTFLCALMFAQRTFLHKERVVVPDTRSFQQIAEFCNRPKKMLTVIVTAAVYRGLGSELHWAEAQLTLPLNLPAPGRRQSVYGALRLSTLLCF